MTGQPNDSVGAPAEEQPDARAQADYDDTALQLWRDCESEAARLREQLDAAREALMQALDCKGSFNGTVSRLGGDPAICTKCEAAARAALGVVAARGYATEQSTPHKSDSGSALDQRAVESRGGES